MPKKVPARPRRIAVRNLHPRLRLGRAPVVRALRALDGAHAALATPESTLANAHELSIVFLTDDELARLHAGFLADPSPTDVITFAGRPALGAAGEICVSADAAARYASAHGRDPLSRARLAAPRRPRRPRSAGEAGDAPGGGPRARAAAGKGGPPPVRFFRGEKIRVIPVNRP